ncbi:hypothetical protein PtA15_11A562 [Puccinia triticina]|uniref:Uncharacterized protein n=1 Tax=Puccinia triticina TaxID=208348 RepID=A0ABY7D1J4_9BASI|nr:uncharacterized protein PtA15_11A562 [Puccinia triticina]WAQ89870.1 hypothetical protein PtA15_11A562 [Puccinia triticina]WAR59919.1 hypothetical protein PtB15_11B560 [Puccinia triticina]
MIVGPYPVEPGSVILELVARLPAQPREKTLSTKFPPHCPVSSVLVVRHTPASLDRTGR